MKVQERFIIPKDIRTSLDNIYKNRKEFRDFYQNEYFDAGLLIDGISQSSMDYLSKKLNIKNIGLSWVIFKNIEEHVDGLSDTGDITNCIIHKTNNKEKFYIGNESILLKKGQLITFNMTKKHGTQNIGSSRCFPSMCLFVDEIIK